MWGVIYNFSCWRSTDVTVIFPKLMLSHHDSGCLCPCVLYKFLPTACLHSSCHRAFCFLSFIFTTSIVDYDCRFKLPSRVPQDVDLHELSAVVCCNGGGVMIKVSVLVFRLFLRCCFDVSTVCGNTRAPQSFLALRPVALDP